MASRGKNVDLKMRNIKAIVIHCSATKETDDYTVEDLKRDHAARGFSAPFGYHYYIKRDGSIIEGRVIERIGAHVKGSNSNSIGICYEGGLDANGKPKDTRTDSQKQALRETIYDVLKRVSQHQDVKEIDICGHRDFSPDLDGDGIIERHEWMKACPCFEARPEYKDLLG